MPNAPRPSPVLPWWAAAGTETCPHCLQGYHYEAESRCEACDAPLCPSCVVRVTVDTLAAYCPSCGTGATLDAGEEA